MLTHQTSLRFLFLAAISHLLLRSAPASDLTLYLLNNSTVRGEILDRTADAITVSTAKGEVKIATADLMPICRQQLKLPALREQTAQAEVPRPASTPAPKKLTEREELLRQVESLLAENQALKRKVAALEHEQNGELPSPGQGPAEQK